MKVPMSWFGDYTDMSGITPEEYARVLTMTGSKVEGTENLGAEINNVVAGKILEIKPHENSDHLVICQVDAGGAAPIQIVTGAPNVKVGQTVPVALHKSTLPGGVKITKGKLRGVMSEGMMCSHEELGITPEDLGYEPEYGILILDDEIKAGTDIKDVFGLNEDVIEYEITSNRPDCFSVIGLARETAVSFKRPFKVEKPTFSVCDDTIDAHLSVEVQDKEKCLRYSARMVKDVKIAPSPKWMRDRLKASGIRAINNIVDITNYVLLEYGQPMHAFDLRDLAGGKIIVRRADEGEIIKTLDEQDRKLTNDDLVIADGERAVAVAGVMGGFNSEVKPDTATVIFESATFNGASVRRTAQRIGLRTESSSRYEKGLDPNNTIPAVERACQLVEMLGCGKVCDGCVDIIGHIPEQPKMAFRPNKINAFLGTDIPTEDMVKILTDLEVQVDTEAMTLVPPSFRPDLVGEADIAEEIARFYGYDKIPTTLLSGDTTTGGRTFEQSVCEKIGELLTGQGMYEICTYTFTSPTVFKKLNIADDSPLRNVVKISNPLGEDTSVMRTTTLGSMMETLARNYNRRNPEARLYEIGKIYIPTGEILPDEPEIIMLGMYGGCDFYDLKGVCETLLDGLGIKDAEYKAVKDNPSFHPGRTAAVYAGGVCLGTLGQIHPTVVKNFGMNTPVYAAELDLAKVIAAMNTDVKYKRLPKFPSVTRDIAVIVDKNVPVADIEAVIKKSGGNILESVTLFDVYEGAQIPEGKKSAAYSAEFRAADRSLTGDEVNAVFDKTVKALKDELGAELR